MADIKDGERLRQFLDLYAQVVRRPLNLVELESDDMYAFQAFERAQRAGHEELQSLAVALQAQRQVKMESLAAATRMNDTYRMTTLARQPPRASAAFAPVSGAAPVSAPPPTATPAAEEVTKEVTKEAAYAQTIAEAAMAAITGNFKTLDPSAFPPSRDNSDVPTKTIEVDFMAGRKQEDVAQTSADMLADLTAALDSVIPAAWPERTSPPPASRVAEAADSGAPDTPAPAPSAHQPPQAERRALAARLDPRELSLTGSLLRLYREHYGVPIDAGRFILEDAYGRAVIDAAHVAGSAALVALATRYIAEDGLPRRHRRGSGSVPLPEAGGMDNRTRTLACDGTQQTLGDFHGIATDCVVRNEDFSGTVVVHAKGFMPAALAPGHAIACRTSIVKVEGPAGSVVALDFVGYPDLGAGS